MGDQSTNHDKKDENPDFNETFARPPGFKDVWSGRNEYFKLDACVSIWPWRKLYWSPFLQKSLNNLKLSWMSARRFLINTRSQFFKGFLRNTSVLWSFQIVVRSASNILKATPSRKLKISFEKLLKFVFVWFNLFQPSSNPACYQFAVKCWFIFCKYSQLPFRRD